MQVVQKVVPMANEMSESFLAKSNYKSGLIEQGIREGINAMMNSNLETEKSLIHLTEVYHPGISSKKIEKYKNDYLEVQKRKVLINNYEKELYKKIK